MKRLGHFTGKLYGENVDPGTIKECCTILNFKEPISEDEAVVVAKRKERKEMCEGCSECEEAKKAMALPLMDSF